MDAAVPEHKDAVAPVTSSVPCSLTSPDFPALNRLLAPLGDSGAYSP